MPEGDISSIDLEKFQLHTPQEVAGFLLELYDSNKVVGVVNEKNEFNLKDPIFRVLSL